MLVDKLRDFEQFSYQEKMIADYILTHPKKVLKMKIKDLAAVTFTSASCITRFCKKVGSRDFPDFKIELAICYAESLRNGELDSKPLRKEMTTQDVMDILPTVYGYSYMNTKKLLKQNIIDRVINYIRHAHRVDIYGESVNFYIAQKVSFNLQTIGISAFAYSLSNEDYIRRQSLDKRKAYSIIISHTGTNESMKKIAKRLYEANMRTLLVVGIKNSEISKYCHDELLFSTSSGAFDLYPMRSSCAIEYIFDIIFAKLVILQYQDQL